MAGAREIVRVLLIDDDRELCELLVELLAEHGFQAQATHDGPAGLSVARSAAPDLVVLDVMLPGMTGFEVLRALRADSVIPVLMLTARGTDEDRITGLDQGADDYLAKPFNPLELVARMRAVLRRAPPASRSDDRLRVGALEVLPAAREARVHGRALRLTDAEFDLLEQLLRRAGTPVSREHLVQRVLGRPFDPRDRSLDVHVSHLRKRLAAAGLEPAPIVTIRGAGYLFALSEADVGGMKS